MIPSAVFLYLISVTIALSPVGEFIVRFQAGCKSIKKISKKNPEVEQRLVPLFEQVYAKAKKEDPTISDKVKMFVSLERSPNAFATGRKTVCVTRGLLDFSDEQIEAVLAHEFGHIAHKDTDTLLVILVSNMLLSFLFFVYRMVVNIVIGLVGVGDRGFVSIGNVITRILVDFLLVLVIRLWTKLGVLLCLHSSRQNEFEADRFACQLGYKQELYSALQDICGDEGRSGFFASIASSHPDTSLRLERISAFEVIAAGERIAEEMDHPQRKEQAVQGFQIPGREQLAEVLAYAAKKTEAMAAAFSVVPKVYKIQEYVYAKYEGDGYHYFGQIQNMAGGKAEFLFALGLNDRVNVKDLVKVDELETGQDVQADWHKKGTYYPCKIKAWEDNSITVTYLDGRVEEVDFQDIRF